MTNQEIHDSFGVNKMIAGDYDPALAAVCNNGIFVGRKNEQGILVFKGIPYAKPPVGALRWKKPRLAGRDPGVYEAYYNGKTPIQTEWATERASYYPQGEDCLYLNIWINPECADPYKTVMVFFHGGSYGWGGTADPLYDGANFVKENPDIVMVTVGYRTGIMGFIDFSVVPGGEDYPDAPNLGLWDQIAALRWVRKNIAAFGGDPDAVTIFGESAGGGSVSLLPITPAAKGLFRRIIAESGSVALTFSKKECVKFTKRLMDASGAKTMDDFMAFSEEELRRYNESVNQYNNFPQRDGVLIPDNPYIPWLAGETANLDVMMGTNANESNYWVGELGGIVPYRLGIPVMFENDLRKMNLKDQVKLNRFIREGKKHPVWMMAEFYNEIMFRLPMLRQAEGHVHHGGKAYIYYWNIPSTLPYRGACHAVELAYVFGNPQETIFTGEEADPKLVKRTMHMWANFARTGDPSADGIEWREYKKHRSMMVLGKNAEMKEHIKPGQRQKLMPLLRYHLNGSYMDMDLNVPFVKSLAAAGAVALAALASVGVGVTRYFRHR